MYYDTARAKKLQNTLSEQVVLARDNEQVFEELLKSFEKHNKIIAYRTVGHFVSDSDDEWSVVLSAFYEAVRSFDGNKGNFCSFADTVIRRRLIDHIRREARREPEFSVDMESETGTLVTNAVSAVAHGRIREQECIKLEITALAQVLSRYDIEFSDLAADSPKTDKTRRACASAINVIADSPGLLSEMRNKHHLPTAKVIEICAVPRKLLERHRKYIVAAVEIATGDYPYLYEYIKPIRTKETE